MSDERAGESMIWKPLTEGIYYVPGQRTVCELIAVPDDIADDISYLISTISIVHHREHSRYADDEAMAKAARVQEWLARQRPLLKGKP